MKGLFEAVETFSRSGKVITLPASRSFNGGLPVRSVFSTEGGILRKSAILAIAVAIAAPMEGLRQYAYRDPVGILTVCYGHTGKDVQAGKKYSLEECKGLLSDDMKKSVDLVMRVAPDLPDKTTAAFADAVFNIGDKIVTDTKNSTLARYLQAGKVREACNQLTRWDKARVAGRMVALPGLTKRRRLERDMCLEGLDDDKRQ